jgi:hypothetical protein
MPAFRVIMNSFARARHTPDSGLSYFDGTEDALCNLVVKGNATGWTSPGYREGVILVRVEPEGFHSGVVRITPETELVATFLPRKEGELPRKAIKAKGEPVPAARVDIVLYHNTVLAEDGGNDSDLAVSTWEIISINASPTFDLLPIPPDALIANHLHMDGGTATNMTDEEFVKMLRQSMEFWWQHAMRAPVEG